jgi:catechol 2,3-dioxygenase-like lactoylglutathione lyase family enzyme
VTNYQREWNIGIGAAGRSALAAARAFYCEILGGRQMHRTTLGESSSMLSFLVGKDLVTTGPRVADDRVTLVVDDAIAIAERCWNAGFEIHVSADTGTIVVIDPFDLEVEVISTSDHRPRRAIAIAAEGR